MVDESGEILMGRWDCPSCGSRGILGDSYRCSACGSPRPQDVAFYLPEDAEVIQDPAAIRAAQAGADWLCAFCGSWMPATLDSCTNCPASLADSKRRQATKNYEAGQVPRSSEDLQQQRQRRNVTPALAPSQPPRRRLALLLVGLSLIGIVGVVALGKYASDRRGAHQELVAKHRARVAEAERELAEAQGELDAASRAVKRTRQDVEFAERDVAAARQAIRDLGDSLRTLDQAVPVEVTAHAWTVRLRIEECVSKDGEGWTCPDGAFDLHKEDRIHHYERVLDHVDTLYRTEKYETQDGYRTETYTEEVAAGTRQAQDGYTTEDLGNGRFKRKPKYRTETVYKKVTKTRQVPRIVTKTRQVPYKQEVHRQDPIRKPWYRFRTKVWIAAPGMSRSGQGLEPLDPEDKPPSDSKTELGARRTCGRSVALSLEFRTTSSAETLRTVPVGAERWRTFADGDSALLAGTELLTAAERTDRILAVRAQLASMAKELGRLEEKVGPLEALVPPLEAKLPPLEARIPPLQAALAGERQALQAVEDGN